MNGYGQSYYNPYATGTSPDAQQASALALSQLSKTGGPSIAASPVSSVTADALKGFAVAPAASPTAALSGASGLSSIAGAAGGASGASSSIPGGGLAGGLQAAGSAVGVLGGLANIYLGFQANKLAKKNLNFQIGAYNNNLQNTVQSYNTSLEDRIRARHNTEGRSAGETSNYISQNRLQANTIG